ncbi:MAG: tryptophan--tRNA ligase [Chthoniobacteraceae bacterium]
MKRILSGIKPTGAPHIGNYFGMMKPCIALQEQGDAFYFIADYHALTTVRDPQAMREHTRGAALDFLACGLDPSRAVIFRQSDVPEHTELAWILSCFTPMPMLENCHAYKDHLANNRTPVHGLFAYPVLMAADILLYDSNVVPVGRDQKQHVEVARDIAGAVNRNYPQALPAPGGGGLLVIPEPSIIPEVATVVGLDGRKMSKSYDNTIAIFDGEKPMRKKIMGIVTDSTPVEAPKDPSNSTIVALYRLFAGEADVAKLEADFRAGGIGYGDFKKRLFETVWEYFRPMREKRAALEADAGLVDEVLRAGAAKARAVAALTMDRVRTAVGLR